MMTHWKYITGCGGSRGYHLPGTEYRIFKESNTFYINHPTDVAARVRSFDFLRDAQSFCVRRASR